MRSIRKLKVVRLAGKVLLLRQRARPKYVKNHVFFRRWQRIRDATDGLMSAEVYRDIYRIIRDYADPTLDIVEVGAAGGGATITIALAMNDIDSTGTIVTVEKARGGSRTKYGDKATNLAILQDNLAAWGVADRVRIFDDSLTWQSGERVHKMLTTDRIGALLHDADGKIHRDFALFWEKLAPGAPIIIDDCSPIPKFLPFSEDCSTGNTKGLLAFRLYEQFVEWGLIEPIYRRGDVVFARKPSHTRERLDLQRCEEIVEEVRQEREGFRLEHGW